MHQPGLTRRFLFGAKVNVIWDSGWLLYCQLMVENNAKSFQSVKILHKSSNSEILCTVKTPVLSVKLRLLDLARLACIKPELHTPLRTNVYCSLCWSLMH